MGAASEETMVPEGAAGSDRLGKEQSKASGAAEAQALEEMRRELEEMRAAAAARQPVLGPPPGFPAWPMPGMMPQQSPPQGVPQEAAQAQSPGMLGAFHAFAQGAEPAGPMSATVGGPVAAARVAEADMPPAWREHRPLED